MLIYIVVIILIFLLWFFRAYFFSLLTFVSVRLEGKEPDFQILNSLRDDLIHERKKKVASLEMILSTWEKGESIFTHLDYFKDLINQLKIILKDQRENLLMVSSNPFLWVRLKSQVLKIERALQKIEKNKQEIQEIKRELSFFSDKIEEILEKATQRFTFSLNEVIKESVKIVRTEKDRVLKEKGIKLEESYEDIGDKFRLPYRSYRDWQKLISNLVRNGVEAVELKLQAPSSKLPVSEVRVLVGGRGDDVAVVVEDNGIGMDEKTRESFYKRGFTQGKEAGLGLGITEETIEFINKYGSWNVESKINEGTRIEIKINKEKAKAQDLKIEDRSALVIKLKSRRVIFALAGISVVVIALGLYFQFNKYARFWEDWNPESFDVQSNILTVKNKSQSILWDKQFPVFIPNRILTSEPQVRITDLNGDGKMEVIVAILHTEKETGKVICFNYKGEKLWEFPCGEAGVYQIGNQGNSRYFQPQAIEVVGLTGDSKKEVVVISREAHYFPVQLAMLDYKGNSIAAYWHPGQLNSLSYLDFDSDGEEEIIAGGINNRTGWRPVVTILDPKRINGQAKPYISLKNIENAKEKWYLIFPHIKRILTDESKWLRFNSMVLKMDLFIKEKKISVPLEDGRCYYLTNDFHIIDIDFIENEFLKWKRGVSFPYDLTEEDKKNWENIEIWKDGIKIQ